MTRNELHILIERYFNAETTVEEERMLRRALVADASTAGDPLVDETRAVMGYALVTPRQAAVRKTVAPQLWRNVAAVAVAVATTASIMIGAFRLPQGECVAYLNGQRISDKDAVMGLMFAELSEMQDASDVIDAGISSDLGEISAAIGNID